MIGAAGRHPSLPTILAEGVAVARDFSEWRGLPRAVAKAMSTAMT
jgi:hypothetical protein